MVVAFVSLLPGRTWATVTSTSACLDTPYRFESFSLFAPALGRSKQILVYLPPGYDCPATGRYPVFYFNDGHDLFDWNPFASDLDPDLAAEIAAREAWYGSWDLNDQLDHAIADGRLPPLIVVGIASDDGMRSRDLAPVPWSASAEGRGAQYGHFITHTVVPTVDRRFRTVADRRCRGIGGASLGGVSALQIGLGHPGSFGLVLSLSPVLGDPAIAEYLAAAWAVGDRGAAPAFLIDFDDDPVGTADLEWLASVVVTATSHGRRATLIQTPGGRHTIASWAERVVPALIQLLAARCSDW
jgi:predicted alpha/beta superfamily hydrolase